MLDPAGRFTGRANAYASARPAYPEAAVEAVLRGAGGPNLMTVADIGAGTGIFARQLAKHGCLVVAVEPNTDMRAAAEPHDRVLWEETSAEATGLRESSVNLVTCAQSFHWFDPFAALAEFKRILRPSGRLALLWNTVDTRTPAGAGYRALLETHAVDPVTPLTESAAALEQSELFANVTHAEFPHEQRLDEEGLLARLASASYMPGPADADAWAAVRAAAGDLFRRHATDGVLVLPYVTGVWTASVSTGEAPMWRVLE